MKIQIGAPKSGGGVCSFATWPQLKEAIEKAFNCSPREQIDTLCIDETGVVAYFELKESK